MRVRPEPKSVFQAVATGWRCPTAIASILVLGVALVQGQEPAPRQDPKILRFVERASAWYPGSAFSIVKDEVRHTASGSYRIVDIDRQSGSRFLTGTVELLIDQANSSAWLGSVGTLPGQERGIQPKNLRNFLEDFLPEALTETMGLRCRIEWTSDIKPGSLIPFTLAIKTGYGEFKKPAAVSADGELLVLGAPLPLDQDPVAYRRQLLRSSEQVTWDHSCENAKVEIVEFSDFECPGCSKKWPLIKKTVSTYEKWVAHGMVAYPLTKIHPWAFRSASAGWCVGQQTPELLMGMKELFYSLQKEMTVGDVTETSRDFVEGEGLDSEAFTACYLRQASLDAIHAQLGLGHRLGVNATPTYFVNGWMVQVPDDSWFQQMIESLIGGQEP